MKNYTIDILADTNFGEKKQFKVSLEMTSKQFLKVSQSLLDLLEKEEIDYEKK